MTSLIPKSVSWGHAGDIVFFLFWGGRRHEALAFKILAMLF